MTFRNGHVSARLLMILLVNWFLRHYFFAVVQTTPIPTQTRGLTIPSARARQERLAGNAVASNFTGHAAGDNVL